MNTRLVKDNQLNYLIDILKAKYIENIEVKDDKFIITRNGQEIEIPNIKHTHTADDIEIDFEELASKILTDANNYTNEEIAKLVDSAPETLDTLNELAIALNDNDDIVKTLNLAIGSKVDVSTFITHTIDDTNPHKVNKEQIGLDKVENKSSSDIISEITSEDITKALGFVPPSENTIYTHPEYTPYSPPITENISPSFGETINISRITSDNTGHITNITNSSITIPNSLATNLTPGLLDKNDKIKLDGIEPNANYIVVDSELSESSTNPIQNQAVYNAIDDIKKDINTDVILYTEQELDEVQKNQARINIGIENVNFNFDKCKYVEEFKTDINDWDNAFAELILYCTENDYVACAAGTYTLENPLIIGNINVDFEKSTISNDVSTEACIILTGANQRIQKFGIVTGRNSIGILIDTSSAKYEYNRLYAKVLRGYNHALAIITTNYVCNFNEFHVMRLRSSQIPLKIYCVTQLTKWVNECYFYLSAIEGYREKETPPPIKLIEMTNTTRCNFYNLDIEQPISDPDINAAIELTNCYSTGFFNPRIQEPANSIQFRFIGDCFYNFIDAEYCKYATIDCSQMTFTDTNYNVFRGAVITTNSGNPTNCNTLRVYKDMIIPVTLTNYIMRVNSDLTINHNLIMMEYNDNQHESSAVMHGIPTLYMWEQGNITINRRFIALLPSTLQIIKSSDSVGNIIDDDGNVIIAGAKMEKDVRYNINVESYFYNRTSGDDNEFGKRYAYLDDIIITITTNSGSRTEHELINGIFHIHFDYENSTSSHSSTEVIEAIKSGMQIVADENYFLNVGWYSEEDNFVKFIEFFIYDGGDISITYITLTNNTINTEMRRHIRASYIVTVDNNVASTSVEYINQITQEEQCVVKLYYNGCMYDYQFSVGDYYCYFICDLSTAKLKATSIIIIDRNRNVTQTTINEPIVYIPEQSDVGKVLIAGENGNVYWGDISNNVSWSNVSGKPTTLSGFGITDGVKTSDVVTTATANKLLKLNSSGKLPADITGSAGSVAWSDVTGKPTTLSGFGITDGVTTSALNTAINNLYTYSTTDLTAGSSTLTTGKLYFVYE